MEKKNCREFKNCERWPGGAKARELGICPVTTDTELDGIHGGKNAGRACWVVAGSRCRGKVRGNEEQNQKGCRSCDFFAFVKSQEQKPTPGFYHTRAGMESALELRKPGSV